MSRALRTSRLRDTASGVASNTRHWARRVIRHTFALSALVALAACAGDGPIEPTAPPMPPVTPAPSPEPTPPAPAPSTGAITVSIANVPAGGQPTIILRSGTVERVVRETRTVDSLPPGDYEVRAEPLNVAGALWDAEPATQVVNVRANQAAPRISINFRRRGASLVLGATGIPSYARGTIRITDPQGVQRTALTGDTVTGLSAGQYTLTADGLETTDGRFEASPSTRSVTLNANGMQAVVFTYGPAKASLTVSINGLPGSALAGIAVTGPSGFSDRVDATRTISGLNPGVYAARAARVASGGFSYDPDAAVRDASLSGTQQRTLAFTYTLATGAIAVSVRGLPTSVSANVVVSGPSGFSRNVTATQTLTDLAPGAYRITTSPVTAQGDVYSTRSAVLDVTVSPSLVAVPADVVYSGSVGELAVSVTGLPPTASAQVKLTRPGGQVTWIAESQTLEGLAPGQYLLEAQPVTGTGDSWDPDIASRQVQVRANQRTEAGIRYTSRSGSLTVSIVGLPSGLPASVRVSGPGITEQLLTTTTTLDGLQPGTFTVTAASVSSSGTQYTPSPASSTISVTRGTTVTRTVAYGGQSTALTVDFSGLPGGLAPSATVSGPSGFTRTLTSSSVLENLVPGAYRIVAARVSNSSASYDATPAVIDVALTTGERSTQQIDYALATGSLAVSVAGLPVGTAAAVSIAGPGGFSTNVPATQTFTRLVPGTYTITAASVSVSGTSYAPTPSTRTVTVSASLIAAAAPVTYGTAVGAVRVTMSGLPAATIGAATLLGPGGATRSLSQSTIVTGLAAGAWEVRGNTVSVAGDRYEATPASRATTILANDTVDIPIGFARVTGRLEVTVSGLPSGTAAGIMVTGPLGFTRTVNSTQNLLGLEVGTYTITTSAVNTGTTTYTPTATTQTVVVTAGSTLSRTVAFAGQTTALTVNVAGVPSGASASITVNGPFGYTQSLNATTTLPDLAAGTYAIAAARLLHTNYGYTATPASQSVALVTGESRSATVTYAVSTGALTVSVSGLPSGVSAPVTVTGPASFSRAVPSTTTIADLLPGTYTITAAPTTSGSTSFTPSTASQTVTVTAGATASRTASYTGNTTALTVTINGVPSGANAAVTVTGPSSYTRALTASETLTPLAAGTYAVEASAISSGGYTWTPTPATGSVPLAAGENKTHTVTYAASTGRLTVTVSGLPTGTSAPITVSGPSGYTQTVTATTTLSGLVPGAYTVASTALTVGSTLFTPSSTSQAVTVSAGVTASRTVTYSGTGTSLALTISGVPSGASGSVAVTGPGGFSQTVGSSTTLSGLAAGTYTLTANSITTGGFAYGGTPATQTVALATGEAKTATVTYAATTGRLTVGISGLPAGTNAAVTVAGPGNFSQAVTAGITIASLAPGTYTVTAANVTAGATLYTPSATSQTIAVTAGATASRSVTYSGTGTALALTISGLPTGVNGSVLVTGPGGFSQTRTTTGTMTGLAAGTYTVAASSVASGGFTYAGSPTSQTVTLATGEAKSATVTYAATTGRLTVNASGLPTGTSAAITVTGPASYSQAVTATTTLNNLATGTYTISASTITVTGTTYTPSAASQAVSVTAGATASGSVSYTASGGGNSGPNLVLEGAHVTQAIQNFAGSVPLVAGREAMVRVFVTTPSTNTLQPSVRVRLYDGTTLFRTFTIAAPTASVPTSVEEGTLTNSWNATLTASDMRVNLRLQVDVDPTNAIAEPDKTDNIWPRSGTASLDVRTVAPFNLVFVPVRQSVNNLTGNITTSNMEGTFLSMTRRMFPLNQINASVRATYTTNAAALQSNDANGAWLTILSELNSLRVADGSAANYYGIVNTSYSSGIAGYAYVPGRAAVSWDKSGSANRVTAHELGHNFGRRHVAACGSGNTDANYPHTGGVIGNVGFNQGTGALVAATTTDIMGYCSTQWISDYTWSNVMSYRGPAPAIAGFMTGPQPVLMVWGRVKGGVVTLEPAVRMVTRPVVADRPGRYRLELRDELGRTMTGFTFTPDDIDHNEGAQAFAFAVPLDATTEARLVSVAVVGGANGTVEQTASPIMAAMIAGAEPTPMITSDDGATRVTDPSATLARSGSANRVTWDNAAWPAAMVRDAASGQVLAYLRTPGDEFVPRAGTVRITFSNGIRSATREYTVR